MGVRLGQLYPTVILFFLADLGFVSGWEIYLIPHILKLTDPRPIEP